LKPQGHSPFIAAMTSPLIFPPTLPASTVVGRLASGAGPAEAIPISNLQIPSSSGTWTPTLVFGGASVGMTFSMRTGGYVKIGQLVTLTVSIRLSAKGSSTGDAAFDPGSLPFPLSSRLNPLGVFSVSWYNNMVGITSLWWVGIDANMSFYKIGAITPVFMDDTSFANTSEFYLAGFYWTDA
jgi:hypothetical protein